MSKKKESKKENPKRGGKKTKLGKSEGFKFSLLLKELD